MCPWKKSFNMRIAREAKDEQNHICGRDTNSDNISFAFHTCWHKRIREFTNRVRYNWNIVDSCFQIPDKVHLSRAIDKLKDKVYILNN